MQKNPVRRGHQSMYMVIHDDVRDQIIPLSCEVCNCICYNGSFLAHKWRLRSSQTPSHKIGGTSSSGQAFLYRR